MMALGEWMTVEKKPRGPGSTDTWAIWSKRGTVLGYIAWYGRWREYAFFPQEDTVLNKTCLSAIEGFLEERMNEWRAARLAVPK